MAYSRPTLPAGAFTTTTLPLIGPEESKLYESLLKAMGLDPWSKMKFSGQSFVQADNEYLTEQFMKEINEEYDRNNKG